MAEITAPIVTITLVLAAVFVPVAFIPGLDRPPLQPVRHDDRLLVPVLGDQLADLQPGDGAAVPSARARRVEVLPLPLVQPRGCDGWRTRTTRSSTSRPTTGGRSSSRRWLCWPDGVDAGRAAQGVHPDRGPGLPDRRDPDARRHRPRADLAGSREQVSEHRPEDRGGQRRRAARRLQRAELDQPDQCGHGVRDRSKEWSERTQPELRAPALARQAPGRDLRKRSAAPWRWCSSRRRSAA